MRRRSWRCWTWSAGLTRSCSRGCCRLRCRSPGWGCCTAGWLSQALRSQRCIFWVSPVIDNPGNITTTHCSTNLLFSAMSGIINECLGFGATFGGIFFIPPQPPPPPSPTHNKEAGWSSIHFSFSSLGWLISGPGRLLCPVAVLVVVKPPGIFFLLERVRKFRSVLKMCLITFQYSERLI